MPPTIYPFEKDKLEERGYRVFPDALENDPLVFFHVTPADRVAAILKDGLKPGIEVGGTLSTISYAPNSMIALNHWIDIRPDGVDGTILALRFDDETEIFVQGGTHYTMALRKQPAVIGMCTIPSTYVHR